MRFSPQRHIDEISSSRVLQIYGALLAFSNVLAAYFWFDFYGSAFVKVGVTGAAHCWPMAPYCNLWRFHEPEIATSFLGLYAVLGLFIAILFILKRTKAAWWGLCLLLGTKMFLTSMSYDLQGNHQYMLNLAQLGFLFLPHKKLVLPLLLAIFYWGAGLLKFNPEWLSGVTLLKPTVFPSWLEHISLIYVIILETVLVFGLLSSKAWVRYAVAIQFLIFHIVSWPIVGYFYPLGMLVLLSPYVLHPLFKEPWESQWDSRPLRSKSLLIPLAVLVIAQILPPLFFRDVAAQGIARFPALSMLDARVVCETTLLKNTERDRQVYDPFVKPTFIRTHCDPIIFISQLHSMCAKAPEQNIEFLLQSRASTQSQLRTVLHVKNACAKSTLALFWAEFL